MTRAEQPEQREVARPIAAEQEVRPRPTPRPRAASPTSTRSTNVSGSQRARSGVNETIATPSMPARARASRRLLAGHQQRRRLVRAQHARRMRVEGRARRASPRARRPGGRRGREFSRGRGACRRSSRAPARAAATRPGTDRPGNESPAQACDSCGGVHVDHQPIISQLDTRRAAGPRSPRGRGRGRRASAGPGAGRTRPMTSRASETVKCVGCGRSRNASMRQRVAVRRAAATSRRGCRCSR